MQPHFAPLLHNERVALIPLAEADFDNLYAVAADPEIWLQHPHKNRWQKEVFRAFFDTSLNSNGAFKIIDKRKGQIVGATRFYEYDAALQSVLIGGTFYATTCWGTGMNHEVKQLMLDHIFQYIEMVHFHIDRFNIRSQVSIERLGARRNGTKVIAADMIDFIYSISKSAWPDIRAKRTR